MSVLKTVNIVVSSFAVLGGALLFLKKRPVADGKNSDILNLPAAKKQEFAPKRKKAKKTVSPHPKRLRTSHDMTAHLDKELDLLKRKAEMEELKEEAKDWFAEKFRI